MVSVREAVLPVDQSLELSADVFGNYIVLYMPQDNGIDIVQVAHGARDLPAVIRRPAQ